MAARMSAISELHSVSTGETGPLRAAAAREQRGRRPRRGLGRRHGPHGHQRRANRARALGRGRRNRSGQRDGRQAGAGRGARGHRSGRRGTAALGTGAGARGEPPAARARAERAAWRAGGPRGAAAAHPAPPPTRHRGRGCARGSARRPCARAAPQSISASSSSVAGALPVGRARAPARPGARTSGSAVVDGLFTQPARRLALQAQRQQRGAPAHGAVRILHRLRQVRRGLIGRQRRAAP